jgi:5-methylcytosine-specific restriction endonuclease McrA
MEPYRHLYRTQAWRRLSRAVLARDGYRCATPGCANVATTADHFPVGAWEAFATGRPELFWDLENLIARCRSCNSRAGARVVNSRRRGKRMPRRSVTWEQVEQRALEQARQYEASQRRLAAERRQPERRPSPRIY